MNRISIQLQYSVGIVWILHAKREQLTEFILKLNTAAGGELTDLQKMLAMNAMKENPHHGRPVYTPRLTVHFRLAGEVLHAAEASLAASCARATCALAHRNQQICM